MAVSARFELKMTKKRWKKVKAKIILQIVLVDYGASK